MSDNLNDVNSSKKDEKNGASGVQKAGQAAQKAKKAADTAKKIQKAAKAAKGVKSAGIIAKIVAVAWPVALAILIILMLIGLISFITSVPGMMMDKIVEISSGLWQGFKSFFEGNAAYITEEDQTRLAEYIENMGYDVVGYGFASPDEIKISTENTDSGTEENVTIKSKYLFAYLLADYNTYAIHSDVKDSISKFWHWLWGGDRVPLSGMLKFDDDVWIDGTTVEVDRDTKTLKIEVWNPEIEWLNVFNTDIYTFNLDGWTGRYGKPLEFLLSLHISTMAPDLAYHVASDKEFDTKVHIGFDSVEGNIRLQYVVNAETIEALKSAEYEGVPIWDIPNLEYLLNKIGADGTLILSPEDLRNILDVVDDKDENIIAALEGIGMTEQALRDAVSMCEENGGKGKQLLTKQPYIKYVEKAWYKNIYFIINDEVRNAVPDDEWLQTAPDFNAYETTSGGETSLDPYDFEPSADSDQANIVSDTSKGVFQILETRQTMHRTQKSQPLKGNTNTRIKELFVGAGNDDIEGSNPKPEYYIYDGSVETAKLIEELRKKEEEIRSSGTYTEAEISKKINEIDENDVYRKIDFNKNSLSALTILENMKTQDADFILRDFKSLLIELKYFKASDLQDKNIGLLDWIIPEYEPADWPNRKYEKQNYDYGTYIRSKASMDALREQEENDSDEENEEDDEEETTSQVTEESGDGFPSVTKINKATYRNYKQTLGSYASNPYWEGTIATDGCGPTSAAIVASGYGNYEATPDKMADKMVSNTTLEKVQSALNDYNISSTVHYAKDTKDTTKRIRESLKAGKPVIVLMSETTNSVRTAKQFSGGGHFLVLLAEENGTLIMSNPGRTNTEGNRDTLGLEAFVRDYMTEYSSQEGRGYLLFNSAPSGSSTLSVGFEANMDVITPGIGEVTKVSGDSITIKFTESNIVKDMTMTIKGFTVDSSISVGTMLDKEQKIGTTTDSDILVILRAPNKSIIENVEDYMPPPNSSQGASAYYGELTEDEFEFFAAVLVAENSQSEETMAAVANVIKNRALDTVHFTDVNTITEVLTAPNQYGSVYKVPGSGAGTIPGGGEKTPPAGARTYKLEGKGEYWVGNAGTPREATEASRIVAREVLNGERPDEASQWLGKLALFQVTLADYQNSSTQTLVDQHKLYINGELYSHDWGSLTGNPDDDSCTMP